MLVDTHTVTAEHLYVPRIPSHESTTSRIPSRMTPRATSHYIYNSENVNVITIIKHGYETKTTTNINEYAIEYTNYLYAKKLMSKSDMTKRKEFKLIFSDLFDMLSNQDVGLYNSLLARINVSSSSMYVLQSLLRLSYTYRKDLSNWEPLLIATKDKYLNDKEYDVDMELNGLFA